MFLKKHARSRWGLAAVGTKAYAAPAKAKNVLVIEGTVGGVAPAVPFRGASTIRVPFRIFACFS